MDNAFTARTRSLYETVADTYATVVVDAGFESTVELALIDDFVDQLGGDSVLEVLDAGCGTGRLIGHLRSRNNAITATGVDLSPAMLEHARSSYPDVTFLEADLQALPFEDRRFHGVLAWYSIIHTPPHTLPTLFNELHRVLRPGGLLLLGYQAGIGERIRAGAYGHDVELHAFLHHTPYVQDALKAAGMTIEVTLDRGPRRQERLPQGFILARRSSPPNP